MDRTGNDSLVTDEPREGWFEDGLAVPAHVGAQRTHFSRRFVVCGIYLEYVVVA